MAKWQPMETAPRDGTWIIVWWCDEYHLVQWGAKRGYKAYPFWITETGYSLSRYWKHDSGKPDEWQIPTGWIPLPEPPDDPDEGLAAMLKKGAPPA